eukprot:scaffold109069_cov31-Tisochrysis_lutea.AAC.3
MASSFRRVYAASHTTPVPSRNACGVMRALNCNTYPTTDTRVHLDHTVDGQGDEVAGPHAQRLANGLSRELIPEYVPLDLSKWP